MDGSAGFQGAARPEGLAPCRPLRILHTENTTAWGGQEIRILDECTGLLGRGHDVRLLAAPRSRLFETALARGIPSVPIDLAKKGVRELVTLRSWLSQHGRVFDVVNVHGSTDSWLTGLAAATLRDMPPIVRTRHVSTTVNRSPATRWLYLRSASHVVTTGEAVRRQLHRDNGYPLEHMTSVPTGIDLRRFVARDRSAARQTLGVAEAPTLGVLATLRSWKGHDDLLEAFALLSGRFPPWRLLIVGDGPQRVALEAATDRRGLRDRVRFVGNVDAVPDWLSTLDLFALPSYGDEGVPQAIMQAMACGLPVVSTTVGAIDEAVRQGVTGTLVAPRDPKRLAEALGNAMGDAAARARMGRAGRDHAERHFGVERMLDRMERVFERVAIRRLVDA